MLFPLQRPFYAGELDIGRLAPLFAAVRPIQYALGAGLLITSLRCLTTRGSGLRFLVIWMYAAVFPFSFVVMKESWLELRYVYYAAAPLCGLLALGVMRAYRRRAHGQSCP